MAAEAQKGAASPQKAVAEAAGAAAWVAVAVSVGERAIAEAAGVTARDEKAAALGQEGISAHDRDLPDDGV